MTDPNPYSSPGGPADAEQRLAPPEDGSPASDTNSLIWYDTAWGVFAGLCTGAAVGWFCCWYVSQADYGGWGAAIGGGIGLLVGCVVGLRHGLIRRGPLDSNIGNLVCPLCALPAGLLVLFGGGGLAQDKFTGLVMVGMVFGFPMGGMLVGALFDRVYENILRARQ